MTERDDWSTGTGGRPCIFASLRYAATQQRGYEYNIYSTVRWQQHLGDVDEKFRGGG